MKICSYADSGPWWWGARSFDGLVTVTNGFSTKNGARGAVLTTDFYDLVLFWTPLPMVKAGEGKDGKVWVKVWAGEQG